MLLADSSGEVIGLLAGLRYPVIDAPHDDGEPERGPVPSALAELDPQELNARLVAEVRAVIAAEMRLDPAALASRRPLLEQGVDSVLTVVIRRELEKRYRCSLPTTLLWRQPTITAIAGHLTELLTAAGASGDASAR